MLLSSIPHPTIDDCAIPAKALVAKYPFLADAIEDGRTSHVSYFLIFMVFLFSVCLDFQFAWMKFIAQRCSNVNRGSSGDEPRPKRGKKETSREKHLYLEDFDSIVARDTPSAFDQNYKKMMAELSKSNPNADVLNDLMEQTYSMRRKAILTGDFFISDIIEKYTLLKKPKHVRLLIIIDLH